MKANLGANLLFRNYDEQWASAILHRISERLPGALLDVIHEANATSLRWERGGNIICPTLVVSARQHPRVVQMHHRDTESLFAVFLPSQQLTLVGRVPDLVGACGKSDVAKHLLASVVQLCLDGADKESDNERLNTQNKQLSREIDVLQAQYQEILEENFRDHQRIRQKEQEYTKSLEHEVARRTEELKQTNEHLQKANQIKSQFLTNVSHELRTPLNAIVGYTEMLIEDAEGQGQPETIADLRMIRGASEHLLALINDILDLSKIEAGKMGLFLETFEVSGMVHEVVTTLQPLVAKNANTLEVDVADDSGAMYADLTKVRQSLFNLLSNAGKFTKQGTVTLVVTRETEDEGAWVTFRVIDTGIGMTPKQMEKLFQAFSQVDASTTRQYGGTGLGLAISRRFCQMMGGDVTVESAVGRGSTFTIRLPAAVVVPSAKEPVKT